MSVYNIRIDWLWNIEPSHALEEDVMKQALGKIDWDGKEKDDRETN